MNYAPFCVQTEYGATAGIYLALLGHAQKWNQLGKQGLITGVDYRGCNIHTILYLGPLPGHRVRDFSFPQYTYH